MKIVTAPDPLLRQISEPCEVGDANLAPLAMRMANTMYATDGVGIAAPQVGILKRLIVVDCDLEAKKPKPIVLVNPVIEETWGDPETAEEGCLSCPGIQVPITRPPWARVRYFDLNGEEHIIESDGLLGRCLQHEVDHLDGKTLFESAAPVDRMRALTDYQKAQEAGARPGQVSVSK